MRTHEHATRTESLRIIVSSLGDRNAVIGQRDALWLRSAALADIERVDRGGLFTRQLEVEDVEILGDALWLDRLRNRGATFLQVPAQHHLSRRLAVLPRDLEQRLVVEAAFLHAAVRCDSA